MHLAFVGVVNVCASRSSGNDVLCRAVQVYLEDAGFDWKILGPGCVRL